MSKLRWWLLAHVARADLDDAVRQGEPRDRPLGTCDHVGEQRRRLFRGGEREDLDLVEFVGPQHPAGVAPRRAGLAPVRRAVGHHPDRQCRVVEDLVGVDRSERNLGGRNAPQIVAFDGVGVVGELGELPGRRHYPAKTSPGAWRSLIARLIATPDSGRARRVPQRGRTIASGRLRHGQHRGTDRTAGRRLRFRPGRKVDQSDASTNRRRRAGAMSDLRHEPHPRRASATQIIPCRNPSRCLCHALPC